MKIISYRKFPISCLVILICLVCVATIEAQRKTAPKSSNKTGNAQSARKKTNVKNEKFRMRTISAGIINGKAMKLVAPEYPVSARAVRASGTVSVSVTIDEDGNVVEASANNGHPFLRQASIKAALESKFEQVTLGGQPVKIRGIIVYNFIPQKWNWLEIGYALGYGSQYYSVKTLLDTFPSECVEERHLIKQWLEANENQDKIIETVIALIRNKLNYDAKTSWHFEVGLTLAQFKQERNIGTHSYKKSRILQNIKHLIQNPPAAVDDELLLERMRKFIVFVEKGEIKQAFLVLEELEERFSYVGR